MGVSAFSPLRNRVLIILHLRSNLLATRGRKLSIFQHTPRRNLYIFGAMPIALLIAIFFSYIPWLYVTLVPAYLSITDRILLAVKMFLKPVEFLLNISLSQLHLLLVCSCKFFFFLFPTFVYFPLTDDISVWTKEGNSSLENIPRVSSGGLHGNYTSKVMSVFYYSEVFKMGTFCASNLYSMMVFKQKRMVNGFCVLNMLYFRNTHYFSLLSSLKAYLWLTRVDGDVGDTTVLVSSPSGKIKCMITSSAQNRGNPKC
jgi:hypothetical protein